MRDASTLKKVTFNETPHVATLLIFIGLSALASWGGYREGKALVEKRYFVDEPLDYLFGGFPGMAVFFGLSLQFLCVELMRFQRMKKLDRHIADAVASIPERFMTLFSHPLEQPMSGSDYLAVQDPLLVDPRQVEAEGEELLLSPACLDFFNILLRRVPAYAETIIIGAAANELPIDILYEGGDILDRKNQQLCLVLAFLIMGLQVTRTLSSCRSDQRSAEVVVAPRL